MTGNATLEGLTWWPAKENKGLFYALLKMKHQDIMKTLEIKDGHKTFTIHDNGNEFLSMERRDWNPYTQKAEYQSFDMRRSELARMLDVLANVNEEAYSLV